MYDCYLSPLNSYVQPSISRQPQHVRTTVERRSTPNFTNFPIYSTRGRVLDSYHTQNLVEDRNFLPYQDTSSSATFLPSFSPDCSSKTPSRVDSIQSISTSTNVFEAQTSASKYPDFSEYFKNYKNFPTSNTFNPYCIYFDFGKPIKYPQNHFGIPFKPKTN